MGRKLYKVYFKPVNYHYEAVGYELMSDGYNLNNYYRDSNGAYYNTKDNYNLIYMDEVLDILDKDDSLKSHVGARYLKKVLLEDYIKLI